MARSTRKTVKKKGKVVLASGTFDLLHLGHVKYLEEAKQAGGKNAKLVVIVARDSTAENRKGRRTVMPEDQRRALVESLKVVDEAILGYEDFSMENVIDVIKPDIIAVGHDQTDIEAQVRKAVEKKGLNIKVIRVGRFGKPELNSSLKIKRKIMELYKGKYE
jgi:FAD synthetase